MSGVMMGCSTTEKQLLHTLWLWILEFVLSLPHKLFSAATYAVCKPWYKKGIADAYVKSCLFLSGKRKEHHVRRVVCKE